MAPSTRLKSGVTKRVNYSHSGAANPFADLSPTTVTKVPSRAKPVKKECTICASNKTLGHFIGSDMAEVCEHMHDVCKLCVGKMIKTKVSDWDLAFEDVKKIIGESSWESWDTALTKNLLTSSPNFITCLNPKCGEYFSIEDDTPECEKLKRIRCPICSYTFCNSCNRPWHADEDCDQVLLREEHMTQQQLEAMGTKPCPECGIQILKVGGCDHMRCRCPVDFIWE